jgi:hypothetical protein
MYHHLQLTGKSDVCLTMDEAGATLTSTESEAVSSCHLYMMLGYIDEEKLAYLFHSDAHYPA